jgi:hypothetical protein
MFINNLTIEKKIEEQRMQKNIEIVNVYSYFTLGKSRHYVAAE